MFHTKTRIIVAIVASVVVLGGALIASGHATFLFGNGVLSFSRNNGSPSQDRSASSQNSTPLAARQGNQVGGENTQDPSQAPAPAIGTTTDVLFGEFLEAYKTQQELGGELPTSTKQDIARSFSEKLQSSEITRAFPLYSESDLNTVPTTQQTQSQYNNKISEMIDSYRSTYTGDERKMMQEAAETRDRDVVARMKTYVNAYHELARELSGVAVPNNAASAHLSMTNAYFMLGQATQNMTYILNDPFRAFIGVAQHERARTQLLKSIGDLQEATPIAN